jgi:hypothetical protein
MPGSAPPLLTLNPGRIALTSARPTGSPLSIVDFFKHDKNDILQSAIFVALASIINHQHLALLYRLCAVYMH